MKNRRSKENVKKKEMQSVMAVFLFFRTNVLTEKKTLNSQSPQSDRRGSNPRSRPWQGRALPTTPLSHKAGDGNRTHVSSLEGWCSTIELHPRIAVLFHYLFPTTILIIYNELLFVNMFLQVFLKIFQTVCTI